VFSGGPSQSNETQTTPSLNKGNNYAAVTLTAQFNVIAANFLRL